VKHFALLRLNVWHLNRDYQIRWLKKLDTIVNNEELRLSSRKNGREFALQYDWNNAYKKWQKLFVSCGVNNQSFYDNM
jgi:hypothetical protein